MKNVIEHKMRVFIFPTNLSEAFLILKIIQRPIIITVHRPPCQVLAILIKF
jgi:hypothetical protein